jgi:hypothetical protein
MNDRLFFEIDVLVKIYFTTWYKKRHCEQSEAIPL